MIHLKSWDEQIALYQPFFEHYKEDEYSNLGNHSKIFKMIVGDFSFRNYFSYFSVMSHERYLKEYKNAKCFIWSNGIAIHSCEFSSIELTQKIYKEVDCLELVDSQTIKIMLTRDNCFLIDKICSEW